MLLAVTLLAAMLAVVSWQQRHVQLHALENTARGAEFDLEQSRNANRRMPDVVARSELRRLELVNDLAQLDVARFRAGYSSEREQLNKRRAKLALELAKVELQQLLVTSSRSPEHGLEVTHRINELKAGIAELSRQIK